MSYFEQEGRHIELNPGDIIAYDVSCPHSIISPAFTRHDVVIVPKARCATVDSVAANARLQIDLTHGDGAHRP